MKKQQYLSLLLKQSPDWIRQSVSEPTRYMTATHVRLHYIALRRMRNS